MLVLRAAVVSLTVAAYPEAGVASQTACDDAYQSPSCAAPSEAGGPATYQEAPYEFDASVAYAESYGYEAGYAAESADGKRTLDEGIAVGAFEVTENPGAMVECFAGTVEADRDDVLDKLFNQTMDYVQSFVDMVRSQQQDCAWMVAASETGPARKVSCLSRVSDVVTGVHQMEALLLHREAARKCFSPSAGASADVFRVLNEPEFAHVLDHPALQRREITEDARYYEDAAARPFVGAAVESLAATVAAARAPVGVEMSHGPAELPELWRALPWQFLYLNASRDLSAALRGGFLYAQVTGEQGLLRVNAVNGERFLPCIGPVYQAPGTFYPPHFHPNTEIYSSFTTGATVEKGVVPKSPSMHLQPEKVSAKSLGDGIVATWHESNAVHFAKVADGATGWLTSWAQFFQPVALLANGFCTTPASPLAYEGTFECDAEPVPL